MRRFELKRKRRSRATLRAITDETAAIETVTAHGGAVVGPFTNRAGRERWHLGFVDPTAVDDDLAALDRHDEFTVVERTSVGASDVTDVHRHLNAAAALLDGCRRLPRTVRRILRTAIERGYCTVGRNG